MSLELLQTVAPFVPTGFAILMLLLTVRKMGEEVYVPKIAPLIVIGVTTLAAFAYATLTRTQINWLVAALLIVGGFLIGGMEGQMTRLRYRGPIIVGKRSVGYLIFWGLAYVLTNVLSATGNGTLHAAGMMTLMFGLGIAVGDNTTLLARQLFLKRPPTPAPTPSGQPIAPAPAFAAAIQSDPSTPLRTSPSAERFGNAEAEYFRLRRQLAAGRITRAQLEATIREMMLQDAQGRWWTMGVDSGRWYVRQGETWVESHPPLAQTGATPQAIVVQVPAQTPILPPPTTQASSRGCNNCACLVMGSLILVLLAAIAVVVGYVVLFHLL